MSEKMVKVGREQLTASMGDMKGFANKLLIMIVSLFVFAGIGWVNDQYYPPESKQVTPIVFLDMRIYPGYLSLIHGVLYAAYIVGIFMKIRQFGKAVDTVQQEGLADQVFDSVTLYHWLLSPFHKAKSSYVAFMVVPCLMCIHLVSLSVGHICFYNEAPNTGRFPEGLYVGIGVLDAVILCISVIVIYFLAKEIAELRRTLGS